MRTSGHGRNGCCAEGHAYTHFAQYEEQRCQFESTQPISDFDQTVEQIKKLRLAKPTRVRKGAAE
ncbi:MAG: hypothetical protein WAO35_20645 [Terriglobia bacterium]